MNDLIAEKMSDSLVLRFFDDELSYRMSSSSLEIASALSRPWMLGAMLPIRILAITIPPMF